MFITSISVLVLCLGIYGFIKLIQHLVAMHKYNEYVKQYEEDSLYGGLDEYFEDDISLGYTDDYYSRHNIG